MQYHYSVSMLLLANVLSKFIIAEKIKAVEVMQPVACIVRNAEQFPTYDFDTDTSIYKYVSPFSQLQDVKYVPPGLVDLKGYSQYIQVQGGEGKLTVQAASALADLAEAFHKAFSKPLVVVSSYRSYGYQKNLFDSYAEKYGEGRAATFSALPGHSEHQLGLAVDIFNASSDGAEGYDDYFAWMRKNAHEYGFTQSYQKGMKVDGYVVEPRHWRYVGKELAIYLWENNMTMGEYVRFWRIWRAGK